MQQDIYCIRCKKKFNVDAEIRNLKNGRPVWVGICPSCNKEIFKFAKKQV